MNSEINNQSVNNVSVQGNTASGVINNVAPSQVAPVQSNLHAAPSAVSQNTVQPQPIASAPMQTIVQTPVQNTAQSVMQTSVQPVQTQLVQAQQPQAPSTQQTTLAAPSKEAQTTISGAVEGMTQVTENASDTPVVPETPANTDNGIREEVKLDTSIAMEGVPTINNSNVSVVVPTHEQKDISEISNQAVINTQKSKTSNTIIIVLLIIMAGCVFFIDDILGFFNTNFAPSIKDNK